MFQTYLKFNGETVPVKKDDYTVSYNDVVSEGSGTTEAGTVIRDVIREGVPSISVNLDVTVAWLKKLRAYKKLPSITVRWLDPETGGLSERAMYMDGFKASLAHDTSYGGLWNVSFTLEDISDV